jgi:Lon protease-like protein
MTSAMTDSAVEISLFPIPGSVSLPYSLVPLHIFEPRYRKMVIDSVEQNRRIGVAHTKRIISASKTPPGATPEEILSQNQESYEAFTIFSAGFVEILEKLPDGRMIIQIQMDSRYEISEELQQVPYKIVRCKPYVDETSDLEEAKKLRKQLDSRIASLPNGETAPMKKYIESPEWKTLSTEEYSFLIYSIILMDPSVLQNVLELRSASERISYLLDLLSNQTYQ